MVLEQIIEVSNRHHSEDKTMQYSIEIKDAIQKITDSPQEEQLILETDNSEQIPALPEPNQIDHEELFSYLEHEKPPLPSPEEYTQPEQAEQEEQSSLMENEEAEEVIQKYMIAALLGNKENISYQENERFKWWILDHSAELRLHEQLCLIRTGNVNYGQVI